MLLTWNEERNVTACLASLARQRRRDFEVIVIDAGSTDRTVALAREAERVLPVPLRIEVGAPRLPIGEARNRGVALARAPAVAFVSADAELEDTWVDEALASVESADMVFGRQVHAPHRWTVGAAVRGLRYHFPDHEAAEPLRYASNVASAYRREILVAFPFDPWTNAAEDLVLARRAHRAGYRATYNPRMVVHHHDVATARDEMRKNVREGHGCGVYCGELGVFRPVLAWGALLVAAAGFLVLVPHPGTLLAFVGVLWLPALRRAARRVRVMPPVPLLVGTAASPPFDLAFLANYVRGVVAAGARRLAKPQPKESLP